MKDGWQQFKVAASAEADRLDAQAESTKLAANAARLVAQAEDPVDGVFVFTDLVRLQLHRDAAKRARRVGGKQPAPLVPVSKLMTGFLQTLDEKFAAIGSALAPHERERLVRLTPSFVAAVQDEDPDVMEAVGTLLLQEPAIVALWLRANLDVVERRFAS